MQAQYVTPVYGFCCQLCDIFLRDRITRSEHFKLESHIEKFDKAEEERKAREAEQKQSQEGENQKKEVKIEEQVEGDEEGNEEDNGDEGAAEEEEGDDGGHEEEEETHEGIKTNFLIKMSKFKTYNFKKKRPKTPMMKTLRKKTLKILLSPTTNHL